ncbi:MAG: SDR family oxidoreductase [Chloroflexota bacterium]
MTDRFVLITGASKGIGQATALRLAKAGFIVFAGVRSSEDGAALQSQHANIRPLLIDVTNAQQIADAAATISAQAGTNGLAGLINNAGMAQDIPLEFMPIEEFRKQIEVNLIGQLAVTQAFLPYLRKARGRIINITSIGGRIAAPLTGAYHASKFALEGLSDTLRQQLAPSGIEVIVIEPGEIATPMWETSGQNAGRVVASLSPSVIEQMMQLYGQLMTAGAAWAQRAAKRGLPPDKAAEVIERALTAPKPHTRYTVGQDAFIGAHIIAKLPDRLRDRLLRM